MINIPDLNKRLIEQDKALRARFDDVAAGMDLDPGMKALLEVVSEGLAAIHERQGNMITLLIRTGA
ncbi:MAG: hypothetical protein ACSLFI_03385 [Solirubrobacterales bacterium]